MMEALIPKLFILTAEASIVLFLLLLIMLIFNSKAKRKDLKAVSELIGHINANKEQRIKALKKHLHSISFKGDSDEQAETLFQQEKTVVKEFVTLYLRHDTYRLLDYPENLIENNDLFLKTSGAGLAATVTAAPENSTLENHTAEASSEQTANATILAREQAEANEVHLKELAELRLKNTELNEHLFETLETITALMTEHGKKTGQEVESNAQKILDAIIYLRDKRLQKEDDPSSFTPPADDTHDQVKSFNLEDDFNTVEEHNILIDEQANSDATLDDASNVNLGINDELNIDLDTLSNDDPAIINLDEDSSAKNDTTEQANNSSTASTEPAAEEDPWADALAEQAESDSAAVEPSAEEDPWADALAEQAESDSAAAEPAAEEDPWADALAEQATADALAEQATKK